MTVTGAAIAAALLACACTSTSISGGEARFDAAPAPIAASDAGTDADFDGGSTWLELHRDFFGPTGRASCAGDGACHGAAEQPGAKATGYVCAPGRDGCYAGITNTLTKLVIPGDTTTPPNQAFLHKVLRKSDGTGIMPKRPQFVFGPADIARIDAWIARGAPNDAP